MGLEIRSHRPTLLNVSLRLALAALLVGLAVTGSARSAFAFDTPVFVRAWGPTIPGSAYSLQSPSSIVADAAGNLYVSDSGAQTVFKFDPQGNFLVSWSGSPTSRFVSLVDLTVGTNSNVYTADERAGDRVMEFAPSGTFLGSFGTGGSISGPPLTFYYGPNGITNDAAGNIYLADGGSNRIQVVNAQGQFLRLWPTYHLSPFYWITHLDGPMAATPDGHLYVVCGNSGDVPTVTEFDTNGNVVTQWGTTGHGPGQFFGASGIGLDSSGNVYVADSNNYRVQVFGPSGNYLGQWGSQGSGNGQFNWPVDVAVVGSSIYVIDSQRIEQFTLTPVAATPTSWGKVKATYR